MSRLFAVTILDSPGEPDQRLEAAHRLGEPSNLIFGNFWDFVPPVCEMFSQKRIRGGTTPHHPVYGRIRKKVFGTLPNSACTF